jgi:catechol 2,3-dioxygenase-like lactoylglutathione lyase family enzyme
MHFDSVRIHVAELGAAARAYALLLGVRASSQHGIERFQLGRGAVELAQGEPGLHALRFATIGDEAAAWPAEDGAFHGLCVRVGPPLETDAPAASHDAVDAIDHVVVHSPDLDRARALWRDRLGLRLALDREFPARGLRMLFFRSHGVTLEFVGTLTRPVDPGGPDRLYGIAYRVVDLEACCARLLAGGIDVGTIRPGHKPGTSVATVRSGTEGVPTLLLRAVER